MGQIRRRVVLRCVLLLLLLCPAPASAQPQRPVGPFVADLRGILARHKAEPSVADALDVVPANMPERSFGLAGGVHWYPWRLKNVTFGVGGEFVTGGSSRTVDP